MAVFLDRTLGLRTTADSFLNPITDSGARKFLTSDTVENNPVQDSTPNAEHLISAAAGLKRMALIVDGFAARARAEAEALNQQIISAEGTPDPLIRRPLRDFSQVDVDDLHATAAREVSAAWRGIQDEGTRSQLESHTHRMAVSSRAQFTPISDEDHTKPTTNLVIPELDSATVDMSPTRGAVDIFFCRITFNLNWEDVSSIRAVRIFRAEVPEPIYTRPLAPLSSHAVDRISSLRGRRNQDAGALQNRLDEAGVPNAISQLNFVDPFTNLRVGAGADVPLDVPPPLAGGFQRFSSFQDLPSWAQHLDRSVLQNINVLSNLRQSPKFGFGVNVLVPGVQGGSNVNPELVLGQAHQRVVDSKVSRSPIVVDRTNKLLFKEVAFLAPGAMNSRRVQGKVEYIYEDETVSFGRGYKYFVVTVDEHLNQSARSAIANVVVEGLRVPPRPVNVIANRDQEKIVLSVVSDDQLVEKFEIFRLDSDPNPVRTVMATTVSDPRGFTISETEREMMSNGYLLIGETLNPLRGGATFTDKLVKPGGSYSYRIYSVDIFGNKSESPFEVSAYIPDLEHRFTSLRKPTILAEVDAATLKVRVTFGCDDPLVENMKLERRDLTIGQDAFTVPTQPPRIIMGRRSPVRRHVFDAERLYNQEAGAGWNGTFDNDGTTQVFVDFTTTFDHVYQYRIYGEDRYGNRTSYDVSRPVMVLRRPFVNTPLNFSASVAYDAASSVIRSVDLSWDESNLDRSAEDLIGFQSDLTDTGVRTLYQIERKKSGEEIWRQFALITGTRFSDQVGPGTAPPHRPSLVELNSTYFYRVQAIQTGAFISNFTAPLQVFVGFGVAQPQNFTLRTPDSYVRPFYVMLNWDTQSNSGVVDRWEVERAEVNNFAAARLNIKNPTDFANLEYRPFRTIFKESSRFIATTVDVDEALVNDQIVVGSHYFMDTMVDFGNSYFYRIRAVSPDGRTSDWVQRGIRVTSAAFEGKWGPVLTDDEKASMASQFVPMTLQGRHSALPRSSFGMQPEFSKPPSVRTEPMRNVSVSQEE